MLANLDLKTIQSVWRLAVGWRISMVSTSMLTACLLHAKTYIALYNKANVLELQNL